MNKLSRREVLLSGMASVAAAALPTNVQTAVADTGEYMFEPGLIYLNTGSLGPTPRSILDVVVKAWNDAPPGPLATALVAFKLPQTIDSSAFRSTLREKHNVVLKQTEKRWGNGMRISPHVFNTEADIDAALKAIGSELSTQ